VPATAATQPITDGSRMESTLVPKTDIQTCMKVELTRFGGHPELGR
jgi:hypothetical protein